MQSNEILVYLTGTKSDNFVASVTAEHDNAIIIHYNGAKDLLTKIAGKRGSAANFPNEIMAISYRELAQHIDTLLLDFIKRGNDRKLTPQEWSRLRAAIIRAVPELKTVIETLEEIQLKQPVITANVAVIYDIFHSVVEVFNPKGIKSLNEALDQWRKDITDQAGRISAVTPTELIESLGGATDSLDLLESFEVLDRQIDQAFLQQTDEIDNVLYDARTGLPNTETDPSQLPSETTYKFRFIDLENPARKLTIYIAHQNGPSQSDLLGADLIYESFANRSIIFVQHKRLEPNNTWRLDLDDKQLMLMLETCKAQGQCLNYIASNDKYLASSEMRLYDCPVFYKILRHDARIDADSRSSAGIYIQACRAKQLQFEHQKALHRETVRDQGMDLSNFSEQFRRAQIGSRASSFMNLKHLIHDYIRRTRANRIVAVATETSF